MGLHDQVMALKWINDNIEAFGGDPEQIVPFGWGSGAASIAYQMISPKSQNLFKRGILQGGTGYYFSTLEEDSKSRVNEKLLNFVKIVNCPYDVNSKIAFITTETYDCLRKLDSDRIISAVRDVTDIRNLFGINPIKDNDFFPTEPIYAVEDGNFGSQQEILMDLIVQVGLIC